MFNLELKWTKQQPLLDVTRKDKEFWRQNVVKDNLFAEDNKSDFIMSFSGGMTLWVYDP